MTNEDYAARAAQFAGKCYHLTTQEPWRTAALGLCSEAGEVASILKKAEERDTFVDVGHLHEELGDVLWYVAELARNTGTSLSQLMADNIAKLEARHGRKTQP